MNRASLLAGLALAALAAALPAATVLGQGTSPLPHQLIEQRWERPDCPLRGPCAHVLHRYPQFTARAGEAAGALNAWVEERLTDPSAGLTRADDPRDAVRAFFDEHRASAAADWFDERRIDVLHEDARVISLTAEQHVYDGGAHPMQHRRLASFERGDGSRIALEELLRDGAREQLAAQITATVRREHRLPAQLTLEDLGFLAEDGLLPLTENFAVTGDGLLFRYDPYDVAPYAFGPIQVLLPYGEIEELLR